MSKAAWWTETMKLQPMFNNLDISLEVSRDGGIRIINKFQGTSVVLDAEEVVLLMQFLTENYT